MDKNNLTSIEDKHIEEMLLFEKIQLHYIKFKREHGLFLFTLIFTYIFGFVISLYMFTDLIVNHDTIFQLWHPLHRAASGRWLLSFAASISSNFSMPLVNGLLGILYISISAGVVVEVLRIKHKICCVLIGSLMVATPTVANTFAYMNCADAYFFSIMLISLAVLVIDRVNYKGIGIILGTILVCLSLGIYQAYFGFGLALCILLVYIMQLSKMSHQKF